jgi:hypothetical protein
MAEIVNLREFRKKKEREEKASRAARNRALAGRTPLEKTRDREAAERAKTELDHKKLEGPGEPDESDANDEEA